MAKEFHEEASRSNAWPLLLSTGVLMVIVAVTSIANDDVVTFCPTFYGAVLVGGVWAECTHMALIGNIVGQVVGALGLAYFECVNSRKTHQPWGVDVQQSSVIWAAIALSLLSVACSVNLLRLDFDSDQEGTDDFANSFYSTFITFDEYRKDNQEGKGFLERGEDLEIHDDFIFCGDDDYEEDIGKSTMRSLQESTLYR